MHTEGLFEAAFLITASLTIDLFYVLLIFLFKLAFPYSGTRAAAPGPWHDEVRHTEGLFETGS